MSKITVEAKVGRDINGEKVWVSDEEQRMLFGIVQQTQNLLRQIGWGEKVELMKVTAEVKLYSRTEAEFQLIFTLPVPPHLSLLSQPTNLEQIKIVVRWEIPSLHMSVYDSKGRYLDIFRFPDTKEETLAVALVRAMQIGIYSRLSGFQDMASWLQRASQSLGSLSDVPVATTDVPVTT